MFFKEITNTEKEIKEDFSYKLICIGNSGVGKSNFILRILGKDFQSDSPTTIGVELFSKYYIVSSNSDGDYKESVVKVNIWDTAGQERYKSVTSSYYKGAKGVFVLYDLTKQETFESVDEWIRDANLYCQLKPNIIIIGTKVDLSNLKIIDELKQKAKADFYNATYLEISSKEDFNVKTAFLNMIEEIHTKTLKEIDPEYSNSKSSIKFKNPYKEDKYKCCGY